MPTTTRYLVPDVIAAPSCLTECKRLLRDVLNSLAQPNPDRKGGDDFESRKYIFKRSRYMGVALLRRSPIHISQ